jgi:hypothetical protein
VGFFQHGIAEYQEKYRGDWGALGQATAVWLWSLRLLVKAEGDLSVGIERFYPFDKIDWHSALGHHLL